MENLQGNATEQQPNPSLESLGVADTFKTFLGNFHWRTTDYLKFCEVLGYTPDQWAEDKYRRFQELVDSLNQFDSQAVAKMLEAGK